MRDSGAAQSRDLTKPSFIRLEVIYRTLQILTCKFSFRFAPVILSEVPSFNGLSKSNLRRPLPRVLFPVGSCLGRSHGTCLRLPFLCR